MICNRKAEEIELYQETIIRSLDRGDFAKSAILMSRLSQHRPVFTDSVERFYNTIERELTVRQVLEIDDEC